MPRIVFGITYSDEYDPALEFEAMSVCHRFQSYGETLACDAPLCPLDPNLFAGRHWYPEFDAVCYNRKYWQHPMVRAQRRIAKRPKAVHLDLDWGMTVPELIHLGTKKRKASPQALAALAKFREEKASGTHRNATESTRG